MDEYAKEFKLEVEKLYDEILDKLDALICETLVTMSFCNDNGEENDAMLQKVLIDFIQEKMEWMLKESEESK